VRQTAELSVNGVTFTRAGNQVDDVIDKAELSLNSTTDGPETITIAGDTARIETAIIDLMWNTTRRWRWSTLAAEPRGARLYRRAHRRAGGGHVDRAGRAASHAARGTADPRLRRLDSTVRTLARKIINPVQDRSATTGRTGASASWA
jgi:hypothetical protein